VTFALELECERPGSDSNGKRKSSTGVAGCWARLQKQHSPFLWWLAISFLALTLLLLEPLVNPPVGLVSSTWFTGKPYDHGERPCGFDYEGSWQIGRIWTSNPVVQGGLAYSNASVINCAIIGNATAASYVAEPTLVIPPPGACWLSTLPYAGVACKLDCAFLRFCELRHLLHTPLPAEAREAGPVTPRWYALYQVKNLRRGVGEIGAAESLDAGRSWRHLGIVLSSPRAPLSSPWVTYDADNRQYVLIPGDGMALS
jgi:hypothetical protein